MPSRPDLRELAAHVKDAFGEMDRETLLDILTFVVKEYVVEGPPPMLVHQTETLADLQGLTFAQLIAALQTRLDHPELSMFAVDGDQVSVRVGGVMQPLVAARQPLAAGAGAGAVPSAAELPRPHAGVRVVETSTQQRPAPPPAQQAQQGSAPPPARGLSVRGRPAGEAAGQAPPPQPQATQPPGNPSQPAPPQAGQAAPGQGVPEKDKPEGSGDDASARFSLLELD